MLDHNRPIQVPCDDSVVRVFDGRELPIRRSRGYAPLPVDLGRDGPAVLAVGGELKNTFCLTDGPRAFMSGHIGDMGNCQTLRAFERAVEPAQRNAAPPGAVGRRSASGLSDPSWAERHAGDRPLDLVQHHHAHVVSLLAEHGRLGEPIIGVSFDGTGYGCDGTIWGGEILALGRDSHRFTRVGHLMPMPLPGGDAAVRNPLRLALSQLWMAGIAWTPDLAPVAAAASAELRVTLFPAAEWCVLCSVLEHGAAVRRRRLPAGHAASDRLRGPSRNRARGAGRIGRRVRATTVADGCAHRRGDRSDAAWSGRSCRRARRCRTGGAGGRHSTKRSRSRSPRRSAWLPARYGWWASPAGCSRMSAAARMCRHRLTAERGSRC